MPRNAPFGLPAGSPNYAQGRTPNRFAAQDEAYRQSRAYLSGRIEPFMEVLPTWAPFSWAWSRDQYEGDPYAEDLQPEDAIAAGALENERRNIWGSFYYGYHYYHDVGRPEDEDASYTEAAYGASPYHAYHDPSAQFWHYSTGRYAQPEIYEVDPWDAEVAQYQASTSRSAGRRSYYGGVTYNR